MRAPADLMAYVPEGDEMEEPPRPPGPSPVPWWAWVVIMVGLGELGWFGTSFLRATRQSAATATEIADIQHEQNTLAVSLDTLDADVESLNVNVAVLSQKLADRRRTR